MVKQRRYFVLVLFTIGAASIAFPKSAEAGPLLDWLFQRNRSQGLAGTGQSCFGKSCLFGNNSRTPGYAAGGNQNPATANPYAALGQQQNNPYATTAGYAPQQGSCGPGWCQQTVMRWVPQIAYRNEVQQVPVTTYKTSTSINPANGLPRTCTRPCTTYTAQARRVPYTTYRPVYTTVPVADTMGSQQAAAPNLAGYPPNTPGYTPTYAYQPPTGGAAGCVGCQNNQGYRGAPAPGAGGGYSNWSTVPNYTPGNANNLPPAAGASPWSNSGAGYAGQQQPRDYAGRGQATPWGPVNPNAGYGANSAAPWQSTAPAGNGQAGGGYDAAGPWRAVPPSGVTQGPGAARGGETPADSKPRLRPEYPEDYGQSTFRPLKPQPMTKEMRDRINGTNSTPQDSSYWNNDRSSRDSYVSQDQELFRTPNQQGYAPRSTIEPPANQLNRDQQTRQGYFRGGIRDLDGVQPKNSSPFFDDKTADRKPAGTMPLVEETTRTRYAAAPIRWEDQQQPRERPQANRNRDWRNDRYRSPSESRRRHSDWTPVR